VKVVNPRQKKVQQTGKLNKKFEKQTLFLKKKNENRQKKMDLRQRFRPWWKHKHHGLEMGCTSGDHERGL
jgi:hypothetical protein